MEIALRCLGLTRCYGGVNLANDHIDFELRTGEVHALLGENGAGKSTLMKMLYGLERPDGGRIFVGDREAEIRSSADAIRFGIGMVHQELMLIPSMTVAQNIVLGQEMKKGFGRLDMAGAERKIRELATTYGFQIDPAARVSDLSIGEQQRVEIIKLLYRNANILIFDEPTALLTPQESDALFEVMRMLKNLGKSIIFITHKLGEVYQIADRMTVMRRGRVVGTTTPGETDREALTVMMVGRHVSGERRASHSLGEEVFAVRHLSAPAVRGGSPLQDVSFSIRKGEILGVAGIEGNGQTLLAMSLLGLARISAGEAVLEGRRLDTLSPKEVRRSGVSAIPDDRKGMGLVTSMRIFENLLLNRYDAKPFAASPLREDWQAARAHARELIKAYSIAAADEEVRADTLSGGNQQKIVVARELADDCRMLIAAQPTRGVDVSSASYIQERILKAAEGGCAVLLISSDLDELLKISDRIMVLFRGRVIGTVDGDEARREDLGRLMLGEGA